MVLMIIEIITYPKSGEIRYLGQSNESLWLPVQENKIINNKLFLMVQNHLAPFKNFKIS